MSTTFKKSTPLTKDTAMNKHTEKLTDEMIRRLRDEALAAGDTDQVASCDAALRRSEHLSVFSRCQCAAAINKARAKGTPFVRVVP